MNEDTQVKKFDSETISTTSTVFLRNCKNSEYILDGVCTKVMIGEYFFPFRSLGLYSFPLNRKL